MKLRAVALATLLSAGAATAQERTVPLMDVPIAYTDVIDAFEPNDPLDVRINLEFVRTETNARIQREQPTTRDDGVSRNWVNVADSERVTNTLAVGLDVGVYHDLMVFGRLPLVLSDERELRAASGARCEQVGDPGCALMS